VTSATIADTGVLAALVYERDQWHEWVKEQAAKLTPPFLTCEPVIAEACFLVQRVHDGERQILAFIKDGYVHIDFSLSAEIAAVAALMRKYEDVPMSLADACLVRMSELRERASVFTLDSDFRIYRRNGRDPIPLIIPDAA
jgi:predicted nucleic acid-binding protein